MDASASLRQTVTHLFDAVKFSTQASEMEAAARESESRLEADLAKLEAQTEEISSLLSRMGEEASDPLKELSRQLEDFLSTASSQAKERLETRSNEEAESRRRRSEVEKDKALKSLEAYLATDPLPSVESMIRVKLDDGVYDSVSHHEVEGGMKYEFRLASQNSALFHKELLLSELGYELKVPVRFSRAILKKARVPGFERLDQYVLSSAETSGGRIRATFQRVGNGANLKVVTSGPEQADFVGLEYSDSAEAVNVMNDPALSAFVDLAAIRKATAEIVGGMLELAKKKVALLRLTLNGEEPLDELDYGRILDLVMQVQGSAFKSVVSALAKSPQPNGAAGELTIQFIKERLKVIGKKGQAVSHLLGIPQS